MLPSSVLAMARRPGIMPIEFTMHPEHNCAHILVTGEVTAADIFDHAFERASHPLYRPGMNTLYDLRQAIIVGELRELHRLATHMRTVAVPSRTALVSTHPSVFGISRMFEQLTADSAITYLSFQSMDEARNWLGLPEDFPPHS